MSEVEGTLPPADDRSPASERDTVSYPFDGSSGPGEKWRAPHRYSKAIWPFVFGLALGILAPELFEILSGLNQWAMWLAFPFVVLVARPEFRLDPDLVRTLSQDILFVQFPLEGLFVMLNLRLKGRLSYAVAPVIFLHLVGAFVLFLLTQARS
jgi:hypothetical protein